MQNLTESERAYRRGALQAIQFLKRDIPPGCPQELYQLLANYEQELISGRTSLRPTYFGTYMDTIRQRVNDRSKLTLGDK